jgi:hypothetical protein
MCGVGREGALLQGWVGKRVHAGTRTATATALQVVMGLCIGPGQGGGGDTGDETRCGTSPQPYTPPRLLAPACPVTLSRSCSRSCSEPSLSSSTRPCPPLSPPPTGAGHPGPLPPAHPPGAAHKGPHVGPGCSLRQAAHGQGSRGGWAGARAGRRWWWARRPRRCSCWWPGWDTALAHL